MKDTAKLPGDDMNREHVGKCLAPLYMIFSGTKLLS